MECRSPLPMPEQIVTSELFLKRNRPRCRKNWGLWWFLFILKAEPRRKLLNCFGFVPGSR